MRVSQWQNIAWTADAFALGLVVLAGIQFAALIRAKAPPVPGWTSADAGAAAASRWPGERSAFDDIHSTPIGGPRPAPPTGAPEKPPVDPAQAFRDGLVYLSGAEFPDSPERSLVYVRFDGKELWLRPGDFVGKSGFQLIEFTIVAGRTPDAVTQRNVPRIVRLAFAPPAGGEPVWIEQPDPQSDPLVAPGRPEPPRPFEDVAAIRRGRVPLAGLLGNQGYRRPNGEWVISEDEQIWIEEWGETHLLPHLGMRTEWDAAGNPRGVRITELPETNTPLAPSHGLCVGDVVRSINGVALSSKDDLVEYLRGPGKGLYLYRVVVETDGAERTIRYRVPRPVKASRD